MRNLYSTVTALALAAGLSALSASAQEASVVPTPTGPTQEKTTPPTPGTAEHAAQLQREHDRAVAAGDHANDPMNPASSNALNQQEAAKAAALGNGPVPADSMPGAQGVPNPNLPDPSGNTAGTLPADPDPTVVPPPADTTPPSAGDSLKPDPATVK